MDKPYFLRISKDRQTAVLEKAADAAELSPMEVDDLLAYLKEKKVVYGIKLEELEDFCQGGLNGKTEIIAAEGNEAKNGQDAFLINELTDEHSGLKKQKYNFRNVSQIPSVKLGQLIATLNPCTEGKSGIDVFGNIVAPKPGKPLKIKAGKNVVMKENNFYAAIDGQVSFTPNRITVNPTFELNGDLDLKTGNIDFIGNVIIRGNVPTGYEIKAGGDVRISGMVEGAVIEAGGNIVVTGGIAGAHRGRIISGGSVHSAYLNQAHISAKQSVYVEKSILHSDVRTSESIHCEHGVVIGGSLTAGRDIFIKELGNHLYVKTFLYAGFDFQSPEEEQKLNDRYEESLAAFRKLSEIEIHQVKRKQFSEAPNALESSLLQKQRKTKDLLQKEINAMETERKEIEKERNEKLTSCIWIYGNVQPNSFIHFGKYAKAVQHKNSAIKYYFQDGEIHYSSIAQNKNGK